MAACAGEPPSVAAAPSGTELGSGLQHRRRYLPREADSLKGANGNGWVITSWPGLYYSPVTYDGFPQVVSFTDGQGDAVRFERHEAGYVAGGPARWQLELGDEETKVTRDDGARWRFFGFESLPSLCGKLKECVATSGSVTIAEYDGLGRLLFFAETHPAFPEEKVGLYYTYAESGLHRDRLLSVEKRRTRGAETIPIALSTFSYYPAPVPGGCLNDLRTAATSRYDAALDLWRPGGVTYYRYYTQSTALGGPSGLQFELGPGDVARLVRDGHSPFAADDETMARYAARHYQYDPARRITFLARDGGASAIRYQYLASDATPGRNWARRVIETHSDGRKITTYHDERGALRLQATRAAAGFLTALSARDPVDRPPARESECNLAESPNVPVDLIAALVEPRTPWENYTVRYRAP